MNNENFDKYAIVIKYILQDYTTEQIAEITGYSTGTIRNIYSELRKKYNVNTKTGIALSYLRERLKKLEKETKDINSILKK